MAGRRRVARRLATGRLGPAVFARVLEQWPARRIGLRNSAGRLAGTACQRDPLALAAKHQPRRRRGARRQTALDARILQTRCDAEARNGSVAAAHRGLILWLYVAASFRNT